MKTCQACQQPLSPDDLLADPYTNLCRACWTAWQVEAGTPLIRYGKPGTVCTSCGMMFGGTKGFDRHRRQGRCLSPAELQAQNTPMTIRNGIWVKDTSKDAFFSSTGRPKSDFPGAGIPR